MGPLIINILLGLWLMAAPTVLGYDPAASDNGHIVGPLIVTFATIALWEATNAVRYWILPVSLWLLLAPWVLGYSLPLAIASDMIVGVLSAICAWQKKPLKHRYGGGWRALWRSGGMDT